MADTLRYFTEFGKHALQKTICGGIYARVYCIFSACTTSLQRKFTFAISSPDEFLVLRAEHVPQKGIVSSPLPAQKRTGEIDRHVRRPDYCSTPPL